MPTTRVTTLTAESIDKFRAWLYGRGLSDQTVKAYTTDLKVMLQDLEEIELPMEEYEFSAQNWLTGNRKVVAPKTTRRRLTSVRMFAKWAGWGDLLTEYSAPSGGPTLPHPLPEGLEGVRRMLAVARNPRQQALVALCGLMGARISEALKVSPSDFDLHEMHLKIFGKGEKIRYVPVSEEAWSYLAVPVTMAFVAGGGPVVGIQDRVARANITKLGELAGLSRRVASHDLRATFATAVFNKTQDIRLVQELLGHSSVETTQIYVGVKAAALKAAVEL
jgi:site-specific recombinase XerD